MREEERVVGRGLEAEILGGGGEGGEADGTQDGKRVREGRGNCGVEGSTPRNFHKSRLQMLPPESFEAIFCDNIIVRLLICSYI